MQTKRLAMGRWLVGGLLLMTAGLGRGTAAAPKVLLNEAEFRDRVYACWLGKNIGGTLGMPFEGKREPQNISFYTRLKPGQPEANDDLDLQILWLKAMEENNGRVDARILGEYWLKYVPVDWNEYGIGKRNMRQGWLPPVSGEFNNAQWKHSNGAWIRSEIWACLAPGCPALAAQMAREDACVDHGSAEGTLAEIFTASLESAAFVESDRDKLLAIGLSMIPENCGVARAVRTAMAAKQAGKDWQAARLDVLEASKETGWFQAPRNVAYTMLGWLYGEGDFGKSICIAVNCGDDTDCTGATLGSIWGIIHGTKGIPERWSAPVGTAIKNVAISGFEAPKDLSVLTEHTVAMTKKVLASHDAPVALTSGASDVKRTNELNLADTEAARKLWALSPWQVVWTAADCEVVLDYRNEPLIQPNKPRFIKVVVRNHAATAESFTVNLQDVPADWTAKPEWSAEGLKIAAGGSVISGVNLMTANTDPGVHTLKLQVIRRGMSPIEIPLTLQTADVVGPHDLALASQGATATSDSELDKSKPSVSQVIDGFIAIPGSSSNGWHSSTTTPHPHWVEVKLPKAVTIGRVIVRFADPADHPVDFQGLVSKEGSAGPQPIFTVKGCKETRFFRTDIAPITADSFRLLIQKSANKKSPNAAQISEIELYPPR